MSRHSTDINFRSLVTILSPCLKRILTISTLMRSLSRPSRTCTTSVADFILGWQTGNQTRSQASQLLEPRGREQSLWSRAKKQITRTTLASSTKNTKGPRSNISCMTSHLMIWCRMHWPSLKILNLTSTLNLSINRQLESRTTKQLKCSSLKERWQ